jgi:hypothetical protein
MKTTRVSAVESPVAALKDTDNGSVEEQVYECVRLVGPEEKLIPLVDAILFYCQVARLRPARSGSLRLRAASASSGAGMRLGGSVAAS